MPETHSIVIEPTQKRIRAIPNAKTVADSLRASLLLETDNFPVYYFPRDDIRMDFLEHSNHRRECPYKGRATYWTLRMGGRSYENVAWSFEQPKDAAKGIAGQIAFDADRLDHWFEEDEEVFGHPRDPHHRVDVRASTRRVQVYLDREIIADTRRGLFLFETGLPARYYIPPEDVRAELLIASDRKTICPYKGTASYWSLRTRDVILKDAVWAYREPLSDCPRIKDHLCFYPDKVSRIEVEGDVFNFP